MIMNNHQDIYLFCYCFQKNGSSFSNCHIFYVFQVELEFNQQDQRMQKYSSINGRRKTQTSQKLYEHFKTTVPTQPVKYLPIKRKRDHMKTQSVFDSSYNKPYNFGLSPRNEDKKFMRITQEEKQDYHSLKNKLESLGNKLALIKSSLKNNNKEKELSSINNKQIDNSSKDKQNSAYCPSKAIKMRISGKKQTKQENCLLVSRSVLQSPKRSNDVSSYVTQVSKQQKSIHKRLFSQMFRNNQSQPTSNMYIYYVSPLLDSLNLPSSYNNQFKDHFLSSFQFFKFVSSEISSININSYPPPSKIQIPLKPVGQTKKNTIVFDLDQTLIHCDSFLGTDDINLQSTTGLCLNVEGIGFILINLRPYMTEILKELSKYFELILFTASHSSYANSIANYIDPKNEYFSGRFYREHCSKTEQGYYLKDLRILNRPLQNILLVDNAAYSYCLQPDNGVPIIPFYDSKSDKELLHLVQYLKKFISENDMRIKNKQFMKNSLYSNYLSPEQFIHKQFVKKTPQNEIIIYPL